MSQLALLDKKFREKGLQIIGAEAHRSGKAHIGEVVASQKVKFSITNGVKGPISILGLPHVVVFGADGKLIFSGHPNDKQFEKTVKRAVADLEVLSMEVITVTAPSPFAERVWKNHEGKPLVASLKKIDGVRVILKFKNGREVPYEINKFSEDDQGLIRTQSRDQ